jgi:hypothetical protein
MSHHDYRNDLAALARQSARDLPSLEATAGALRAALHARRRQDIGGFLMSTMHRTARHRWATTLALGLVATIVLFFVPVSYEVLRGHEVDVELPARGLDGVTLANFAAELGAVLETEDVAILSGPAHARPRLTAAVGERSRERVEALAATFAASLARRGVATGVAVRPLMERITGNIASATAQAVVEIRIDKEGSPDEIAAEVRAQLEAAGIEGAHVSVDPSGGCAQVSVQLPGEADGGLPEFRLSCGDAATCKTVEIAVERTADMTEEELIAEVERQLAEHGLSGSVSIAPGGLIQISVDDDCSD